MDSSRGTSSYSKCKLKKPIVFDLSKISTEGMYIEPNMDAEEQLREMEEKSFNFSQMDDILNELTVGSKTGSGDDESLKGPKKTASALKKFPLGKVSTELKPILDSETPLVVSEIPLTDYDELQDKFHIDITDNGDLKKMIIRVGNGNRPPTLATVWVNYETWCEEYDEPIFRSEKPYKFRFFQPDIMPFFDMAVSSMHQMEIAYFLVQPNLAFKEGVVGAIPEDSRLLYKVELLKFQEAGVPGLLKMPEEELKSFKFREVMTSINELKMTASCYLEKQIWRSAYDLYRRAAHFLERYFELDVKLESEVFKNIFHLHNNLAYCSLKMNMFERAVFHCSKALQLPEHTHGNVGKVLYRRAIAEFEGGKREEAFESIREALRINPVSKEIQAMQEKIKEQLRLDEIAQKTLFKKMIPPTQRQDTQI